MKVTERTETEEIQLQFESFLNQCTHCSDPENRRLISKAFNFAMDAHRGMRRKSGEPYILHPLEVARIVHMEIGLGVKSIVSALYMMLLRIPKSLLMKLKIFSGKRLLPLLTD
jgi:GTP pyrophosphokinase